MKQNLLGEEGSAKIKILKITAGTYCKTLFGYMLTNPNHFQHFNNVTLQYNHGFIKRFSCSYEALSQAHKVDVWTFLLTPSYSHFAPKRNPSWGDLSISEKVSH